MELDLDRALSVARDAVAAAGAAALAHLRRGVVVETKPDLSPVTAADRAAEDEIIAIIRAVFPDHAILGEEGGAHGAGDIRWIVDPIDGTRGFARGGIMWGPMIALEVRGELRRRATHAGMASLVAGAASTRCYGDLAGCALVLDGRAEAWIEGGVKEWDLAAPAILVEEAGGRFTDWTGARSCASGYGIASNGRLHDVVLRAMLTR